MIESGNIEAAEALYVELNHEFGEIKKVIEQMSGPERLRLGLSFVFEYSLVDCAIKKGPDIARGITQSAINAFERGIPAEEALTMLAHEIGVPLQDAISLVSKSSSTSKIIGSGITKVAKQTIATGSPAVRAAQEVRATGMGLSERTADNFIRSLTGETTSPRITNIKSLLDRGQRIGDRIETMIDENAKIIFRKDFLTKAHPIMPKYRTPVNHYNIDIQAWNPKDGWTAVKKFHIVVDEAMQIVDFF